MPIPMKKLRITGRMSLFHFGKLFPISKKNQKSDRIDAIPRHPGQLYEALAYFSIFIFLNLFSNKIKKEKGYLFGLFLVLLFSARFFLEFFKIDQVGFEAGMVLNMGQILSLPFIFVGLILMNKKNQAQEKSPLL